MKLLDFHYDKITEYPELSHGFRKSFLPKEEDSESDDSVLSTQNHYAWNKQDFFDYDKLLKGEDRDDSEGRRCRSVISEDDYPNAAMLDDFRMEFDAML